MFEIVSICKGGGYKYCRTIPPHPKRNAKGLYPLHRVLMENKLGRLLEPGEEVHHGDEDKSNDVLDNLDVLTKSDHAKLHHPALEKVQLKCSWCDGPMVLHQHIARQRVSRAKDGDVCCSRPCAAKLAKAKIG